MLSACLTPTIWSFVPNSCGKLPRSSPSVISPQTEAGELMRMDQPRVSALLRGKIGKFSTDRLLKALSDLGQDVELKITPARRGKGKLRVAA